MTTYLHHILAAIRRTRNMWYGVGVGLVVFGLPMTLLPHVADEAPGIQWAASAIGLLTLATGIALLRMAWQLHTPEQAPLIRLLVHRPRDIVWVYIEQINSTAAGVTVKKVHNIKVCTVGKKALTLQVSNHTLDPVMAGLRAFAPHATFGYDRATQRRYKANPSSLVNATI